MHTFFYFLIKEKVLKKLGILKKLRFKSIIKINIYIYGPSFHIIPWDLGA